MAWEINCIKSRFPGKARMFIKSIKSIQEVVEYSFIVQKSVTYLDLSLGEFSGFKGNFETDLGYRTAADKNVVLIEEAFRKRFAPDRKVLYDFHLDVSSGLELSLRNARDNDIRPFYSSSVLINRISFHVHKHESDFIRMLSNALGDSNQKVKFLHQISKMAKRMKFKLKNNYIREQGLNILCFQGADSTAVVDFLTVTDFLDDHFLCLFIDVFEFLLHQANEARFNLWTLPHSELTNASIFYRLFLRTEIILQYRDAPRFCTKLYTDVKKSARRYGFFKDGLDCPVENGLMSKERHFLILLMLDVFRRPCMSGFKALQLLWRSIPDAFPTVQDLTLVFNQQQNSAFIEDICGFIEHITGEDVFQKRGWEPRELEQHCRIVIRRALSENFQLSTGIGELKLPSSLKGFLRLEY